jgi:hypothetical protein
MIIRETFIEGLASFCNTHHSIEHKHLRFLDNMFARNGSNKSTRGVLVAFKKINARFHFNYYHIIIAYCRTNNGI